MQQARAGLGWAGLRAARHKALLNLRSLSSSRCRTSVHTQAHTSLNDTTSPSSTDFRREDALAKGSRDNPYAGRRQTNGRTSGTHDMLACSYCASLLFVQGLGPKPLPGIPRYCQQGAFSSDDKAGTVYTVKRLLFVADSGGIERQLLEICISCR